MIKSLLSWLCLCLCLRPGHVNRSSAFNYSLNRRRNSPQQMCPRMRNINWIALRQRMVCNGFKRIIKTCGIGKHYVFILSCNPLAFNFCFVSCKITSCALFSRFMPPPNVGGYRPGAGRGYPGRHMRSFTRQVIFSISLDDPTTLCLSYYPVSKKKTYKPKEKDSM